MVLLQVTNFLTQQLAAYMAQLQPVDADAAFLGVVQAAEHAQQGGLARPNRADDGNALTGLDLQLGHHNHRRVLPIGKLHIGQLVMALDVGGHQGVCNAAVIRFQGVQALQALQGGAGVGMLHQQTRQGHDGGQNTAAQNRAGNQGAHGHVPLHHQH